MTRSSQLALLALSCLLLALPAQAGPLDAKVGEVRATYKNGGTPLREEAKTLSAAVRTLGAGTRVLVREVNLPWIRVEVLDAARPSGWLRAAETIEPDALQPAPRPAPLMAGSSGGITQQDISVAGRQFGPDTERRYRGEQPNLQAAYAQVDQMEAATRALDPNASVEWIIEGRLGRPKGQDYRRPPLLPPTPPTKSRNPAADAGKVLGGILDRIGPKGRAGELIGAAVEGLADFGQQLNTKFTPDQEYYLGRAVAANAIARFGLDSDPRRRAYVRQIGDAIVRLSGRVPANYGGYHFDVLASDEINAVSGPGGYVLVTRGAVNACQTEDQLAAFIAHELAHVTRGHGEATLRQGRGFQAGVNGLITFGRTAGRVDDNVVAGKILEVFSQAVTEMVQTSVEHNYGRGAEFDADMEGTYLLVDVVYDHHAMRDVLRALEQHPRAYGSAATHASAGMRAAQLDAVVQRYGAFPYGDSVLQRRRERFDATLGRASTPR